MNLTNLKDEIQGLQDQWHKLIFVNASDFDVGLKQHLNLNLEWINLNLKLSESLINISKKKYPLFIEDIIKSLLNDSSKIYVLQHIDILFDPVLQVHPIRLLENISKRNKIIVLWPGVYINGVLTYAESGHPEYLTCSDFEGKVMQTEGR